MMCDICHVTMKYRDRVKRIKKTKYGNKTIIFLKRYKCPVCGIIRRDLGGDLIRFKHYEKEIIFGVIEGTITTNTFGFEDYPCEMTMKRWLSQRKQLL